MQRSNIVGRALSLGLVALTIVVSEPVGAQDEGERWKLKLTAAAVTSTTGGRIEDSTGFGLAVERRLSRRLGVEIGLLSSELEREAEIFILGEPEGLSSVFSVLPRIDITPVLARLNVHLTPDRRTDWYLGPVVGWIPSTELEGRVESLEGDSFPVFRIDTESAFAWGGFVGVDLPVGDRGLFLTAEATYLVAEIDVEEVPSESFDLDPLVIQAGIGFRF